MRLNPIHVKPTDDIIELIRRTKDRFLFVKIFLEQFGCARGSLGHWLRRERFIPITFLEKICEFNNIDIWNLLDRRDLWSRTCGRTGNRTKIKFSNKITTKIANIIGWILSDGHISGNKTRTVFSQEHEIVLDKIWLDLEEAFKINSKKRTRKSSSTGCFDLEIGNAPLRFILHNFWSLPVGRRINTKIPKKILEASNLIQFAFLAGIFEGDGTFTSQNGKPVIHLEMKNHTLVEEIRNMLINLGFNPTKLSPHRDNLSFSLTRFDEVKTFFKSISSFAKHPKTEKMIHFYGVAG